MNPLTAITLLFLGAIAIGLYLVYAGLRHRKRSAALGLVHASLASAGLVALFVLVFDGPSDKLNNIAALFLVLALVGGVMVFALREENRPPSMTMVTAHAIMGLVGVSLLIVNILA